MSASMRIFVLPDLGEGLDEAEIVDWHVNAGDHVVADQPLVSVETDKAVVEVPCPRSGRVARLHGAVGELVKVGAPLVEFAEGANDDAGTVVGELEPASPRRPGPGAGSAPASPGAPTAAPAVRALAQKLNVDLRLVSGSGPAGAITRDDVERSAGQMDELGEGEPLRGMRRAMAARMSEAHREVVRAGVTDEADIGDWRAGEDITVRIVRAIAFACRSEPSLNAWYFSRSEVRHTIERIDIAIAVDTEDGLIVPVLRNVSVRDAADLRRGLDRLRADATARIVPPSELRGATITLSNFGMFGGRFAELVIVPPQVAIVGAGRASERVVARNGDPVVRKLLPLTVMFDHRVVTGGEGARFLSALKADLERDE